MKKVPWLIVLTIAGTIVGGFASEPPQYNHGTEEEAILMYRFLFGAGFGLIAGLVVDLYAAFRRNRL